MTRWTWADLRLLVTGKPRAHARTLPDLIAANLREAIAQPLGVGVLTGEPAFRDPRARTLANLEAASPGAMGPRERERRAQLTDYTARCATQNPVPPHKTPDNARDKDTTMTQHDDRPNLTEALTEGGITDANVAAAIASAWFANIPTTATLTDRVQALKDENDALAADLREVEAERDAARMEAAVNGQRADGLADSLAATQDTLNATRNTLHTLRDWHSDTRARLERAETPPIMATLETTDLEPAHMWSFPPVPAEMIGLDSDDLRTVVTWGKAVRGVRDGDGFTTEIAGVKIARCDDYGMTSRDRVVRDLALAALAGRPEGHLAELRNPGTDPEDVVRALALAYAALSTPGENPGDNVEPTYPKGHLMKDSTGDVWEKVDDRTPGWWSVVGQDPTAMHRLEWVRQGWGPLEPVAE